MTGTLPTSPSTGSGNGAAGPGNGPAGSWIRSGIPVEDLPGRAPAGVEANGLNVIPERERHGRPSQLFWPWFGANVSVLGLSYGAFALGFGISFWQALIAGAAGVVFS